MINDDNTSFDLVIVGGGLIGISLANLVAQHAPELNIALVDAGFANLEEPKVDGYDPRVVALSKASEKIFSDLGIWPAVLAERACPYYEMFVWDGEGTGNIRFNSHDIDADNLGHIVENSVLLSVLYKQLDKVSQTALYLGRKVEALENHSDISSIRLDNGEVLSAPLIVAADGAKSHIRDLAGFATNQWDYGHSAIVTTVMTEKKHQFTARQRFTDDGPLAFLPLGEPGKENYCSIVWSIKHAAAEKMMALDDKAFCRELSRAFEYKLGEVTQADKRLSIALTQRHAKRYVTNGVVLVGDAAHTIHPLAGQGANMGLYDVKVLCEEIERAVTRKLPLSDISIIKRYERRRQPHNLLAMSTMEGFKRLFGSDNVALRWLRNEGLRRVDSLPWLKNQFSKIAGGQI
ncbi:FAD-dependent monooxygenase [Agarilytica rhodophyticola]|uniref:FAD-dependent monooxygenase n=1 Tax=Agarilytica rhodophyticola TaxID=1737490 RepID=UPI000B3480F6|nr:FAD-dependent monooxygenase [Agarilytica rhodophyticola]